MPQLTELQTWFLVIALVFVSTLLTWAVLVVIPSRNATIKFLQDRNTTLEYWINRIDQSVSQVAPLTGDKVERKRNELLQIRNSLQLQLERVQADLQFYSEVLDKQKSTI